jgi:predicted nucleotide-binding protein
VFLGYCSKAKSTADAIILFVERNLKIDVLNYSMDFRAGPTILEQIEAAASSCSCALLLFTKDDDIDGAIDQAMPRDNVIFEAGYFIRAIGKNRVAIIREDGAKIPADLGGIVYIPIKDRSDIALVETKIDTFLKRAL